MSCHQSQCASLNIYAFFQSCLLGNDCLGHVDNKRTLIIIRCCPDSHSEGHSLLWLCYLRSDELFQAERLFFLAFSISLKKNRIKSKLPRESTRSDNFQALILNENLTQYKSEPKHGRPIMQEACMWRSLHSAESSLTC